MLIYMLYMAFFPKFFNMFYHIFSYLHVGHHYLAILYLIALLWSSLVLGKELGGGTLTKIAWVNCLSA